MIEIEEVADKTYWVAFEIPRINSPFTVYLICGEEGVLIEPGPAAAIPFIQEAMKRVGMAEPAYIIPTHIHMDHAGAAGSLARLFPAARVVLHPRGARHMIDPSRLIESTRMAFGDDFEGSYGPVLPVPESRVTTPVDGEVLSIVGRELEVIHTPGHAPHHLALFDRKTKGLFSGEALGIPVEGAQFSPVPAAAPPSFDIEEYVESMEKLRGFQPRILFYSHDGVGREPEKLIAAVKANTRILGDIVLESLRGGMGVEAIHAMLRERLGMVDDKTLPGFIHYFRTKGLTAS